MRKNICMILVVCLVFLLLAGCSVKESAEGNGDVQIYDVPENNVPVLENPPDTGKTPNDVSGSEKRPLTEEEILLLAKEEISWNYYAVTAEQNPENGNWTVTFHSRDRESFQVIVVDRYGGILQVQDAVFWIVDE